MRTEVGGISYVDVCRNGTGRGDGRMMLSVHDNSGIFDIRLTFRINGEESLQLSDTRDVTQGSESVTEAIMDLLKMASHMNRKKFAPCEPR